MTRYPHLLSPLDLGLDLRDAVRLLGREVLVVVLLGSKCGYLK